MPASRLALVASIAASVLFAAPGEAKDFGQLGAVFPVIEPDLLSMIEARLHAAEASGRLAAMNRQLVERTEAKVRRPPPVGGLSTASARRTWVFDPTITVDRDIDDGRGRLIIARGARVNPLDTVGLRQSLVFLDGDDVNQVRWAMASTTPFNAKLILTSGSPFELMKARQRRFYFDQGGKLIAKFAILHVPAVVEQQGRVLRVTELPVPNTTRSQSR